MSEVSEATPPAGSVPTRLHRETVADLWFAAMVVAALALSGIVLGLIWGWWSPPGPLARKVSGGTITDETEAFVATDGRYLVLVTLAGLVAALVLWWQVSRRGPIMVWALALGGLAGAALTEVAGQLTGGGSFDTVHGGFILQLPVSLHMKGLLFVEPALAVVVYGLFVAFAGRDDLGRPDPHRRQRPPVPDAPAAEGYPPPTYPPTYPADDFAPSQYRPDDLPPRYPPPSP